MEGALNRLLDYLFVEKTLKSWQKSTSLGGDMNRGWGGDVDSGALELPQSSGQSPLQTAPAVGSRGFEERLAKPYNRPTYPRQQDYEIPLTRLSKPALRY